MITVVPISRMNNPLYPLPSEYEKASEEMQRLMRVNAARQWLLTRPQIRGLLSQYIENWDELPAPEQHKLVRRERGELMVASTWFFDNNYLMPDHESGFNPLFYDEDPCDTPEFHWELSRFWATNRMNIAIAPRGSAKSTHSRRDMLTRIVTCPGYSFVYATSSHDNAKFNGQVLKDQCYTNDRIIGDFGPEYNGHTKPSRGEKPTGVEHFYLTNGAWVRSLSAESRQRGARPRRYRLDDPEYDAKVSTSMTDARQYMNDLLFNVALPMVMRADTGLDWLATFVSKQHYAWHAMETVVDKDGNRRAADTRFDFWERMTIRAAYEQTDPQTGEKKMVSCWPSMWPLTKKERLADPDLQGKVSLEEIREQLGVVSFNSEYMARPGDAEDQYFKVDVSARGRHAWWLENVDGSVKTNPYESATNICWNRDGSEISMPLGTFLRNARLFMTVDPAYSESNTADRRATVLMAINNHNELFVLDMWSDKTSDSVFEKNIFRIADQWRCPTVHCEAIRQGITFFRRLDSAVRTKAVETMGFEHIPRIHKIKNIGVADKSAKIAALDLRFEHGLIKMPFWARHEKPYWNRLFSQMEEFNPEAKDGGLQNDDEIDCVSMSMFVIRGRLQEYAEGRVEGSDHRVRFTLAELLERGELKIPGTNLSIFHGTNFNDIEPSMLEKILELRNTTDERTGTRI